MLVVLRGLPGAGKTTLARAVAGRRPVRVLSRDDVRARLFAPCDWTEDEKEISFRAVLDAAAYELGRGRDVLLDGMPFSRVSQIQRAREAARVTGARCVVVECRIDVGTAAARIVADGDHAGREAGADSAATVAARFDAAPADLVLDATRPLEELTEAVLAAL